MVFPVYWCHDGNKGSIDNTKNIGTPYVVNIDTNV